MTPSYMLLRAAFALFVKRWRYIYWYGAKGELLTDPVMNQLIETYPEFFGRFSEDQLNEYKRISRGKIGVDCSGFITLISGIFGNTAMIWERCVNKTTPREGKAGSYLYRVGHCAIDIGYGYCMEIGAMGETFTISKISDRDFVVSGELPNYDYGKAVNY